MKGVSMRAGLLFCAAAVGTNVSSQALTAKSLRITVEDVTGAVIPGAVVTLADAGEDLESAVSDAQGIAHFESINPRVTLVSVRAPGFRTRNEPISDVERSRFIHLDVGQVGSPSVTVESEPLDTLANSLSDLTAPRTSTRKVPTPHVRYHPSTDGGRATDELRAEPLGTRETTSITIAKT